MCFLILKKPPENVIKWELNDGFHFQIQTTGSQLQRLEANVGRTCFAYL